MKNKSFWLAFVASFILWMCIIITVIWFFPWHRSKGKPPIFAHMVTYGIFTPDKIRILYVEDYLWGKPDSIPFNGFIAFDENFTKIDMIRCTPEIVQAGKISIISDSDMKSIALISPTVKQGIIWDSGKKQFQLVDTELLRKQIDEKSEIVLWASWRNRVETKPGVTPTN